MDDLNRNPGEPKPDALVRAGDVSFMGRPLMDVVQEALPPETAPLSIDDWKAMSNEERVGFLLWFLDEFKQNTEGITVQLPRLKYPGSGNKWWSLEGENGKAIPVDELRGVILTKAECRVFYKPDPSGEDKVVEGAVPDCMSADCVTPDEMSSDRQHPTCAGCPQSKWGSGKGGVGQACKKRIRSYQLLRRLDEKAKETIGELDDVPTFISLPPTALRPMSHYAVQLTKQKKPMSFFETVFALIPAKNKNGVEYSGLKLIPGEKLSYTEVKKVKNVKEVYGEFMRFRTGKDLIEDVKADVQAEREAGLGAVDPDNPEEEIL